MVTGIRLALAQSLWFLTLRTCWGTSQVEGRMEQRWGLGRGVWAAGSTEMERLKKPAVRLGCVGEEGAGFDHKHVYDRKVTVYEHDVNLCLCVFSLPGQVCSYLTPTPVSESCGAGLIVSVDVCYCVPVSVCDMLSLDPWIAPIQA